MGLGSGIQKKPGSRVKMASDPGSGSATLTKGYNHFWSDLHVELNGVHAQNLMAYV
jgi:hypothetical protein